MLAEFELNGYGADQVTMQPGFRMQYRGQLNDLEIESPLRHVQTAADWDRLAEAFDATYGRVCAPSAFGCHDENIISAQFQSRRSPGSTKIPGRRPLATSTPQNKASRPTA